MVSRLFDARRVVLRPKFRDLLPAVGCTHLLSPSLTEVLAWFAERECEKSAICEWRTVDNATTAARVWNFLTAIRAACDMAVASTPARKMPVLVQSSIFTTGVTTPGPNENCGGPW